MFLRWYPRGVGKGWIALFSSGGLGSGGRRLIRTAVVGFRRVLCWGRVSGGRVDLGLELGDVLSYLLSWQIVSSMLCKNDGEETYYVYAVLGDSVSSS